MGRTSAMLIRATSLIVALGAGATAPAWSQQPTPATKVTALMKQVLADGREVVMVTLEIPPGSGSPPHRQPGHHIFGYVLEGSYKLKIRGRRTHPQQGRDLLRSARAPARRQCQPDRTSEGACHHRGGER